MTHKPTWSSRVCTDTLSHQPLRKQHSPAQVPPSLAPGAGTLISVPLRPSHSCWLLTSHGSQGEPKDMLPCARSSPCQTGEQEEAGQDAEQGRDWTGQRGAGGARAAGDPGPWAGPRPQASAGQRHRGLDSEGHVQVGSEGGRASSRAMASSATRTPQTEGMRKDLLPSLSC